ncbi:MAG: 4Fe-4S binding protein [Candidatus Hatepunaea meridiana]|nr:4Fe-4S binding protein [Candidatus Hatepunaea meridiana]
MKTRVLRYSILTVILGLTIYQALGYGKRSFEAFCPFGGMESLWGLFREGQYSCATGPLNMSMLIAVIVLALIAKKAFCGWACPIGFLSELIGRLGMKILPWNSSVNPKLNSRLKLIRYVGLVLALYFTYQTGELILRGYDPFYIIFSGFGHGTLGLVSVIVLVIIIIGSFLIPMFFCRYFCPLGATIDPFSRLGLVKIVSDEDLCTECGECYTSCPHDIAPNEMIYIRHRDCTNCLECIDSCPEKDCLTLKVKL